jgi:hypothetical protein
MVSGCHADPILTGGWNQAGLLYQVEPEPSTGELGWARTHPKRSVLMSHEKFIQGGSLEGYYLDSIASLFARYHYYPSNLLGLPVSFQQQSSMGYYERMASNLAVTAQVERNVPLGKLVV